MSTYLSPEYTDNSKALVVNNGNIPKNTFNNQNDFDSQVTEKMTQIGKTLIEDFKMSLGPVTKKMFQEDPERAIEQAVPFTRYRCSEEDLDSWGYRDCEALRSSFRTLAATKVANNLRKESQVHSVTEEELRKDPEKSIQRAAAQTRLRACPITESYLKCEKQRFLLCDLANQKEPYPSPELIDKGLVNPQDKNLFQNRKVKRENI